VLPDAAHSINWEQPDAFNRNVLEFIRAYYQQGQEDCHSD
jgi:pimeloyl-ACP methyl ester carboxylesterase